MINEYMRIILIIFGIQVTRFGSIICFDISISDEIEDTFRKENNQRESQGISNRYNECSGPNVFMCQTGNQCIDRINLCDGKEDCQDSSDETAKCREFKCPSYAYQCSYGACIDGKHKCNNVKDCADNSDEWVSICSNHTSPITTTQKNTICLANMFMCKSGECISSYKKCDGVVDCKDGSDETEDLCLDMICPVHSYRCKYGACVHKYASCNKIQDCADNSDENDLICNPTTTKYTPPTRQWNINMCIVPDPPSNGKLYIRHTNKMKFTSNFVEEGSIISYTCNRNYELSPNIIHYTCSRGKWNPAMLPRCIRQRRGGWWPYFSF